MKRKRLLLILSLAGAWLALNAGPIWTQTTPEKDRTKMKESKGERTGEDKMEARGAQDPGRMERKKGEEEMEARGAQKPGRMGKSGANSMGAEKTQGETWARQDIKKAQEALKNKGYDPGSMDGVIGPQTTQAIRAFQSASGLKETGRLDPETAKKLGVARGSPSEQRTSASESIPKPKEPSSPTGK